MLNFLSKKIDALHKYKMRSILQGVFFLVLIGCIHSGESEQNIQLDEGQHKEKSLIKSGTNGIASAELLPHSAQPWFRGSVEEAFAKAQKEQKPMFLYWGAIWCPPCNELKSSVFNQPLFWREMGQTIPVFLDGDDSMAQHWGEKLDVSGYPTLLFLNSQGEEVFRIATGLSLEEMILVLKYLGNNVPTIEALVARLESKKITPTELSLLSYLSWEQKSDFAEMSIRKLKLIENIYTTLPVAMVAERSLVAARLLEYWATTQDSKDPEEHIWAEQHQSSVPLWFRSMTENDAAIFASRLTLIYAIKPIFPSMIKFLSSADALDYKGRWIASLETLKKDKRLNTHRLRGICSQARKPASAMGLAINHPFNRLMSSRSRPSAWSRLEAG